MMTQQSKDKNHFTMAKNKKMDYLGDNIKGMYLARLHGSDGMEDHCVIITKQWIFDSNFDNALPRSYHSLNLCCSSDGNQCECMGFPQIAHFPKVNTKIA